MGKRSAVTNETSPAKQGKSRDLPLTSAAAEKPVVDDGFDETDISEYEMPDDISEEVIEENDSQDDEAMQDKDDDDVAGDEAAATTTPFRYGIDELGQDEVLEMDPSAYDMFHKFTSEWPCLSFDCIVTPDASTKLLGPQDVTIVGGSQAAAGQENALMLFRCRKLRRTWEAPSDEEKSSDDEDDEGNNTVDFQTSFIRSSAAFNKVTVCPQHNSLVATWTDDAVVSVYDVSPHVLRLQTPIKFADPAQKPIATFKEHKSEGFALEWIRSSAGFLTGGRDGAIVYYKPCAGGWKVENRWEIPTGGGGVESLSQTILDENTFASASCDGAVRIWDLRTNKTSHNYPQHHVGDVNVVKFGSHEQNSSQLLSGGDDGCIHLIDLRYPTDILFNTSYHKGPICALDWSFNDFTTFVAGSYDNRCTIWDLSAEGGELVDGVPPQLIFEHCGHDELSCVMFHPAIPYMCISSGADSFNVWRSEDLFQFAKQTC